jgi:ribose transport system permease protein
MTVDAPNSMAHAPSGEGPSAHEVERRALLWRVAAFTMRYGMVWALLIVVIVAQVLYPTFLTPDNIRNMLSQNAPAGIIAVGMTFVIIAGGFDLSVGAMYGLGAVTFAKMSGAVGLLPNVLVAVLVGVVAGLVNGLIIAKMRVNPFVATLGTSTVFLGLGFLLAGGFPVPVAEGGGNNDWLGAGDILTIPVSGVIMVLVFLAGGLLLSWTTFGQNVRAVGGNGEAARLAGLRANAIRVATYVLIGGLAAFAGSVDTSLLGSGAADQGTSLPLLTIAIVILGGTSLSGGEGAMWRTAVGLMIMASLNNLFASLAVSTAVQLVAQGSVLILAVSFDVFARGAARRGAV